MSRRLARLSTAARRWILDEVTWLAERDLRAAERFVERLRTARANLAAFPLVAQPGLIPGTRRLVIDSYVLTVRIRGDDVEIVAIRHARQGYAPDT